MAQTDLATKLLETQWNEKNKRTRRKEIIPKKNNMQTVRENWKKGRTIIHLDDACSDELFE